MKPIRIALTGGIATGKSTVARMFSELGAVVLDADQAARQVVRPGSECSRKLLALLGPDYFDQDGEIKRREVRERIVADERLRGEVNSIVHPSIMEAMEAAWQEQQNASRGRLVIFDIPLLFETRLQDRFQLIILAYAPRALQIARLVERDGVSSAQAEKTLSMQWPIDEKRELSHFIIENGGSLEATRRQVLSVWRKITQALEDTPMEGRTDEPG
ncbi:MAG: dephospho-CoA kinase [Syntrophobacteraceae bacterium]|jgi:dephospho-CoA kinase|nr:dephospho-CoA kinase [Syntrophobacteraceae bacterium]